jgi:hypothetical protein
MGAVLVALVLAAPLALAWPWEAFLWRHYVATDSEYREGYPRRAVNRFRLVWDAQVVATLPVSEKGVFYASRAGSRVVLTDRDGERTSRPFAPPDSFTSALTELLECRPDLRPLQTEIFVSERVTSSAGTFISAYIWGEDSNLHLVTVTYKRDARCAATAERPATISFDSRADVDGHGGYARRAWDVVGFHGHTYLVTLQEDYEYRCFQVYRVDDNTLVPVAHVPIACLGCE